MVALRDPVGVVTQGCHFLPPAAPAAETSPPLSGLAGPAAERPGHFFAGLTLSGVKTGIRAATCVDLTRLEIPAMTLLQWFEEAKREFHEWIELLRARLAWQDDDKVRPALIAVLHALRDSLSAEDAAYLAARLPLILRGAYFEGWRLQTLAFSSRADFLERVEAGLHHELGIDPEQAAHAVFALVAERLAQADVEIVKAATPAPVRGLWPD